jgi:hypothetical protein
MSQNLHYNPNIMDQLGGQNNIQQIPQIPQPINQPPQPVNQQIPIQHTNMQQMPPQYVPTINTMSMSQQNNNIDPELIYKHQMNNNNYNNNYNNNSNNNKSNYESLQETFNTGEKSSMIKLCRKPLILIILFMLLAHSKSAMLTNRIPYINIYNSSSFSVLFIKGFILSALFLGIEKFI